ncbi:hypothetical protein BX600DRAFT_73701 [Xylariales sp. PMI_506]|nr:hypothetical protein BX600DRAFT_73701 [Xylariales sp. PMI_506]
MTPRLSLPKILESALRYLGWKAEDSEYWINTICINRTDNQERSAQVQMMQQIHKQARQVVARLGASGPYGDKAMHVMREEMMIMVMKKNKIPLFVGVTPRMMLQQGFDLAVKN